ncbi:nitroreductase [Pacificimonas sp. WHA3]|uniref:Nitroreductase n=1 Tax=Pacificimonas pallii TaxID=2827236 RepID=A0ABS6SCT2_9SPHN|nr:nitroreductase [Pacificimonas pallii]MBV7256165.1 nitroreductase [Pacificimonas pallii]
MDVSTALDTRTSVRAFTDEPVDLAVLREILTKAARSPSGGNLQPWRIYVVGGDVLADIKARAADVLSKDPRGETPQYDIYPRKLAEPYKARRFEVGEDMYARLGIPREDKAARRAWFANNFRFFGAPAALFCFVERYMGPPQWSDLGMYLQSVMLLLKEAGLDSCPQECWAMLPETVADVVGAPDGLMLFTGMAIGHADKDAPVNGLRTRRAGLDEFAEFQGI